MRYYFAPLEGITGYLFRTAHAEFFPGLDGYFSPFLTPKMKKPLSAQERRDVAPENNPGLNLIPQLLTNNAEAFLRTADYLAELGYSSVNLNLGCPSGTVVPKGKGAGFLAHQPELAAFLETVCARSPLPVSVKTRVGLDWEEEWDELLPLFNRFPLQTLIVHPRLRSDYYGETLRLHLFRRAVEESTNPVAYNGDLNTPADLAAFSAAFPTVNAVLLGRGLVTNPALVRDAKGGAPLTAEELRRFHDRLAEDYQTAFSGEMPVLCKLKELWSYWGTLFPGAERPLKALRKARRWSDYRAAADGVFASGRFLLPEGRFIRQLTGSSAPENSETEQI